MIIECKLECYNKYEVDTLGLEERLMWVPFFINFQHVIGVKQYFPQGSDEPDDEKSILYAGGDAYTTDIPFKTSVAYLARVAGVVEQHPPRT